MSQLIKKTAATLMILSFLSLNVWSDDGNMQCPKNTRCLFESTPIIKTENPSDKQVNSDDFTTVFLRILEGLSFII